MRTEDDLRAALTSLERHAPSAVQVLPGTTRRTTHGLRSLRPTRRLALITTAAALAGAVAALTLTTGPSRPIQNGGVSSQAPITKATLQAKILASFSTATNMIVHFHETSQMKAPYTDPNPATEDIWYYPGQPSAGQQVRARTTYVEAGFGHTDVGVSYLEPARKAGQSFPPVQVKGEKISVDYAAQTWWFDKEDAVTVSGSPYDPTLIASYFKSKQWSARNTTLNGRPTIELTLKDNIYKGKTVVNSWIEYLWLDADTYLPLHDTITMGPPGEVDHLVDDYEFLSATPANLAKLTPPIPAGFKQVAPPPPPIAMKSPAPAKSSPASASPKPSGE